MDYLDLKIVCFSKNNYINSVRDKKYERVRFIFFKPYFTKKIVKYIPQESEKALLIPD